MKSSTANCGGPDMELYIPRVCVTFVISDVRSVWIEISDARRLDGNCRPIWKTRKRSVQILYVGKYGRARCKAAYRAAQWLATCCAWSTHVHTARNVDGTVLSNTARYPKDQCFVEGSQASPVCPGRTTCSWRNGYGAVVEWNWQGKPKYWEK